METTGLYFGFFVYTAFIFLVVLIVVKDDEK